MSETTSPPVEEKKPVVIVDEEMDAEKQELWLEQNRIEKEIVEQFNTSFVRTLKRLSYYLSKVGLPFEEACRMVRVDPKEMKEKIASFPVIQELIDLKELEYKTGLIATVSQKARNGNDKLAQWLLEKRFPEEFNTKKGSNDGEETDLLGMAVEFVQKSSGEGNSLVKETSGRAMVLKKSESSVLQKINDFLR